MPPAQQRSNESTKENINDLNLRDLRESRNRAGGTGGEKNHRGENETSNSYLLTPNSFPPNSSPRVQLAAPTILSVLGTANSFTVTWSTVPAAYSYTVAYSKDPTFATGSQTGIVNAPSTSYTVADREPNSVYYVRVKSYPTLPGSDTASDYSEVQSIRTLSYGSGSGGDGNTLNSLQNWLVEERVLFQNVSAFLPLKDLTLTSLARRRLQGSGTRRYGFIDKVSDTSSDYPQFWPSSVDLQDALKDRLREIEALRNLMVWLRYVLRVAGDLFLVTSDDALRFANTYYATVRAAARNGVPEAMQVFQILESFWRNRRNNSDAEPTQKKLVSHAKAVAEGRRDGYVGMENKSATVTKRKRKAVDKSYPKGRKPKSEEQDYYDEDDALLDAFASSLEGEKGK
jgi:hypothetical protein